MDHCCQYGNLRSRSWLERFLAFQHSESVVAVSYIEKRKILEGEIAQLLVFLVQRKFLKANVYQLIWCNASLALYNPPYLRYP